MSPVPLLILVALSATTAHASGCCPSVRGVDAPTRFITAGMHGRVQTTPGLWVPFEITDWEEGCYRHWRVAGQPTYSDVDGSLIATHLHDAGRQQ